MMVTDILESTRTLLREYLHLSIIPPPHSIYLSLHIYSALIFWYCALFRSDFATRTDKRKKKFSLFFFLLNYY